MLSLSSAALFSESEKLCSLLLSSTSHSSKLAPNRTGFDSSLLRVESSAVLVLLSLFSSKDIEFRSLSLKFLLSSAEMEESMTNAGDRYCSGLFSSLLSATDSCAASGLMEPPHKRLGMGLGGRPLLLRHHPGGEVLSRAFASKELKD